mmetsp:Transcript_29934/g.95656  ORF Transcript_29934/g.95656 Transcript_29934/m.95656 type:complete len:631 (+) Transcript_29934:254-2146(+)
MARPVVPEVRATRTESADREEHVQSAIPAVSNSHSPSRTAVPIRVVNELPAALAMDDISEASFSVSEGGIGAQMDVKGNANVATSPVDFEHVVRMRAQEGLHEERARYPALRETLFSAAAVATPASHLTSCIDARNDQARGWGTKRGGIWGREARFPVKRDIVEDAREAKARKTAADEAVMEYAEAFARANGGRFPRDFVMQLRQQSRGLGSRQAPLRAPPSIATIDPMWGMDPNTFFAPHSSMGDEKRFAVAERQRKPATLPNVGPGAYDPKPTYDYVPPKLKKIPASAFKSTSKRDIFATAQAKRVHERDQSLRTRVRTAEKTFKRGLKDQGLKCFVKEDEKPRIEDQVAQVHKQTFISTRTRRRPRPQNSSMYKGRLTFGKSARVTYMEEYEFKEARQEGAWRRVSAGVGSSDILRVPVKANSASQAIPLELSVTGNVQQAKMYALGMSASVPVLRLESDAASPPKVTLDEAMIRTAYVKAEKKKDKRRGGNASSRDSATFVTQGDVAPWWGDTKGMRQALMVKQAISKREQEVAGEHMDTDGDVSTDGSVLHPPTNPSSLVEHQPLPPPSTEDTDERSVISQKSGRSEHLVHFPKQPQKEKPYAGNGGDVGDNGSASMSYHLSVAS